MEKDIAIPTDGEALRVSELYHENSKQRPFDVEFNRRIYLMNSNAAFHKIMSRAFKSYPGAEFIPMPAVVPGEGAPFERVATMRRSIRRFDGQALTLEELARLLNFSAGITGRLDAAEDGTVQPVRAVPSGGALYPVEVYVCVMAVEGLRPGLYHYAVDRRGLECVRLEALTERLCEATSDRALMSRAAAVFVLAGTFGRSHFKYGERGYRFSLLEAGHLCQNLLLEATTLELGAVPVGGFADDEINAILDIDELDEAAIYLIAAGRPAARPGVGAQTTERLIDNLLSALWAGEPSKANTSE